jgi:WD40 repeat protein
MAPWAGHSADGLNVAFNHAGDRLASSDWAGQVRLWDAAVGRTLQTIPGSFGLQFSADDRLFGPEYSGRKIRLWRLAGGAEVRVLRPRGAGALDNTYNPVLHADGRTLAAATRQGLCFFDLASGEELASVRLPIADAARPVWFEPPHPPTETPDPKSDSGRSGGWMTGGHSGLCLWPVRLDPARPGPMRIGPPRQVAANLGNGYSAGASASADGRVVALPQGDSTLVLHRDRPDRRLVLGPQYDVRYSAVSPDGRWVVSCSWGSDGTSKTVRVWDADTGLPAKDLATEPYAKARFSPDGRWLVTATSSGSRQWEVGSWRDVCHLETAGFEFSPDSRLLAIGDVFGAIRLLDAVTGREVARLTGPDPTRYAPACFTPDGTRLVATCSSETALYAWDLRLIHQGLKELGLDWDWPDFAPADPGRQAGTPRQVEVLLGELGTPTWSPEQKARQAIARYRPMVDAKPDDAEACNNLAWAYATAPEPLRDWKAALPLAERAVQRSPTNPVYRNTLGVAYYRAGRYREAVETLRPNLDRQEDRFLAFDLYFLAMSYHGLGDAAQARSHLALAARWSAAQRGTPPAEVEELKLCRAEAEKLLGVVTK